MKPHSALPLAGTTKIALSLAAVAGLLACSGGSDESSSAAVASQTADAFTLRAASVSTTGGRKRQSATVTGTPTPEPLVSQLIVKYRDETVRTFSASTGQKRSSDLSKSAGKVIAYRRPMSGLAHVYSMPEPMPTSEAFALAKRIELEDARVEYAEPDYVMRSMATPNDPLYASRQWHYFPPLPSVQLLGGANLPSAWDISRGQGVIVAVIDTGVLPHPDLAANLLGGYDFISDPFISNDGDGRDSDPTDPGNWVGTSDCGIGSPAKPSSWHGTHVAGTVAAVTNNGIGLSGVAYEARVLPVRVLGRCGGTLSDIADAIRWAAGAPASSGGQTWGQLGIPANANAAKVINLSLGNQLREGAVAPSCPATYQAAVNAARNAGAVVVAATGNDELTAISFPANCSGVVGVTAHTFQGDSADYANVGAGTVISGPGGGGCTTADSGSFTCLTRSLIVERAIWSTSNAGTTVSTGYTYDGLTATGDAWQGTSMATPHVAGVAALLFAQQPSLRPDEVQFLLTNSARSFPAGLYCSVFGGCGAGLLDASAALVKLADRTPAIVVNAPALVAGGQTATLAATATARNGGSGAFSYSWQQTAGSAVTLNSTTGATVSFTAPNPGGPHTFRATVTDGNGYTSAQTATVRTNNAPTTPAASPGGPYSVAVGSTLSFTVSANDPESDALTYVATNVPVGASFTAATGAFSWPNAGPSGTYNMAVRANDGNVNSAPLTITITVSTTPAPPPPPTPPPSSGGGGGGSLPLGWAFLLLAAVPVSRLIRQRH